jgi:hypothetical protein
LASRREKVSAIPSWASIAAVVLVCDWATILKLLVITCNTARIPTEKTKIAIAISMKVNQDGYFIIITTVKS